MIYPETLEYKIGFITVRNQIKKECISPFGQRLVDDMAMLDEFATIDFKLKSTAEMRKIVERDDLPLGQLHDITHQLRTLAVGGAFLLASELMSLRSTLQAMSDISKYFTQSASEDGQELYPSLKSIVTDMVTFANCVQAINRIIDQYGNVLDSASPELSEIRRELSRMSGRVNSAMRSVMARAQKDGILEADAAPTMRDGRLVLPVAPMNKRRISGIVHDESASGKTIFIEPAEVVEANNRIRELELAERREIARILTMLADELRPFAPEMEESLGIMGELDFIHAKGLYAKTIGASLPHISESPELEWYHACHPVLMLALAKKDKELVPLDITLTKRDRILIISGPNAGGKSVCLKTVGIIQYMMQCGVLPPLYENSHMGIFNDIFIDIGDDQSIENDLSTYSSHLLNMRFLLKNSGGGSLVLIDEFGSGTEPQIGAAIAQAILHQLNEAGIWGVITTHYQNLKHFAEDTEGLVNGSMLYDRQRMMPLFKLSIGNPGSSFAVEIARKIGLPEKIIKEAEEIVGSDYINMDKYLLDIARDKRYWENKRQSIRLKEKKIEQVLVRYESEAEQLRAQRKEILSEAKDEAKRIISESNATIERTIHEIRRSQADKEKTRQARQELAEKKESIGKEHIKAPEALRKAPKRKRLPKALSQETSSAPIEAGDIVKLDGEGTPGKVIEVQGDNAVVIFGLLKTTVKLTRLHHTLSQLPQAKKSSTFVSSSTTEDIRSRQLSFKQDIDVRGMRVDEAIQAVTYFIDDAIQFSAASVRILHGTGTGALRQSIREYLSTVRGVKGCRDEDVRFGGAGITVVDLE